MNRKKIFITGGAGYVGSFIVPELLKENYKITIFDKFFFGKDFLPKDINLKVVEGDIRNQSLLQKECKNHDIFLHLACISNDASYVLDEKLSKTINFDCFEPMVIAAKISGIKRFIYASTSSVYGVSDKKDVTEDHPLVPLTLYNKFKGMCEPQLFKHTDDNFEGVIFRPATVCGYAPRLRLDLSVNILTHQAYFNKKIRVFGGKQLRPNLNIKDYYGVVKCLIEADKYKVKNQIFNVGYENFSIQELADMVKEVVTDRLRVNIDIENEKSDDNRSYHINSDKIFKMLNFKPKHSIKDAINSLLDAFDKKNGDFSFDNDIYFNVKRMQNLRVK